MKRLLLALSSLVQICPLFGLTAGEQPTSSIPSGYTVVETVHGDLNADGIDDVVLLLQGDDPTKIYLDSTTFGAGSELYGDTVNANSWIIQVQLFDASIKRLLPLTSNANIIPPREDPMFRDAITPGQQAIRIQRGSLKVTVTRYPLMGTWSIITTTLSFRMTDSCLALVGADIEEVDPSTEDVLETSINFYTGKIKEVSTTIGSKKAKESWKTLTRQPLACFDTVALTEYQLDVR